MAKVAMRRVLDWAAGRLPLIWLMSCLMGGGALLAGGIISARPALGKCQTKSIEQLRVGDWVLAKDPGQLGPAVPRRVLGLPRNWTEHIVHVQIAGGGEVQATRNHPFYVEGRGWVEARDLTVGDSLRNSLGMSVKISRLWTEDRQADCYNLTVEGVHTFFVLAGDTPVLVHNADGDGVVYRVPGSGTPSGKPYIGRSGNWPTRQRYTGDGRDRSLGEQIDDYPADDIGAGRVKEQQAIDDNGGIENLDNKRNEIAKPRPCGG